MINGAEQFATTRNERTSAPVVGISAFLRPSDLVGSGDSRFAEKMYQKKSISHSSNKHFFWFRVSLFSFNLSKVCWRAWSCKILFRLSKHDYMSSDIYLTLGIPATVFLMSSWSTSCAITMPKLRHEYLFSPQGVLKVVGCRNARSNSSQRYPWFRSSSENVVAPLSSCMMPSIVGKSLFTCFITTLGFSHIDTYSYLAPWLNHQERNRLISMHGFL